MILLLICAKKNPPDNRRICQQYRQPDAAAFNVFGEIKYARRKINQKRDETQKEKSARKISEVGNRLERGCRQQIPGDLKQNHIQENADIADDFRARIAQKFVCRWGFRRRKIAVNNDGLKDHENQSEQNRGNENRAAGFFVAVDKLGYKRINGGKNDEIQTEKENRIEQTARHKIFGTRRFFTAQFNSPVKMPTLQSRAERRQNEDSQTKQKERERCDCVAVRSLFYNIGKVSGDEAH